MEYLHIRGAVIKKMVQDRGKWRADVKTVLNLPGPSNPRFAFQGTLCCVELVNFEQPWAPTECVGKVHLTSEKCTNPVHRII